MIFNLKNCTKYAEPDGGGAGVGTDPKPKAEEPAKAYKTFATEEEYNNALKSERSKAKGELLKEAGVESVDQMKAKFKLADEAGTYKAKAEKLGTDLLLNENNVNPEYSEEALTLAKAKVTEQKPLADALKDVLAKFPSMTSKKAASPKVGQEKGKGKAADDGSIDSYFKNNPKYDYLDL